jgi:hypothetical protein
VVASIHGRFRLDRRRRRSACFGLFPIPTRPSSAT